MHVVRVLKKIFLGLTVGLAAIATPPVFASDADLREIIYNNNLPMEQRIDAMRELTGLGKPGNNTRKICIWDIIGRNGPIFSAAQDQRARLLEYGIHLELVPYTDERVMVDELKAGLCDAALMTGLRARLFNTYTGTIDSIGGLPSQRHMQILLKVLADPRSAPKMVQGDYVIAGVAPGGGAYLFVNDRRINTLAAAAGKKVAVLEYDPVQAEMVAKVGASPVPTNMVQAPNMFNNGVVDVLAAPLAAYAIVELYKGMTPDGGIIDYPIAQISMQLVARRSRIPNEAAQLVREVFYNSYDEMMERLHQETKNIPDHWWIPIPEDDKREYEALMRDVRIQLRERGYYSADMLALQRRIRCELDPTRAECVTPRK
ncbi:MAG TPA: putative solute-binding protein [Alcanivorax sp.]|nr:putative solute-binding protein [Alcanivorax sp.]